MAIHPGTHFGPYEIQSALGAGGMGEVYRARDTRLNRVVAIKVLPSGVADNPERRERFDREARAISSLNHPHICTLHDVGRHEGTDYLVMELLEGQTLDERLARGALPLEQALQYGIQIAEALDAAHQRGIVHRDLKPANVMLTTSGAKLFDFGIARAVAPGTVAPPGTLTAEGVLLGTLHYMAPEQLEGRDADARSDIFAFGAVLYEMLTGRRAFSGESQSKVIAAVLDSEPLPIVTIQSQTPPALDHLVATCLAKSPDERWQSASDLRRQLEWIASVRLTATPAVTGSRARSRARGAWTVAAIALVAALVGAATLIWSVPATLPGQPARVTRTMIASSGAAALRISSGRSLAVTTDGTHIIYVGNNGTQLFVRPLDRLDATAIYTSVAPLNWVFISPDGQSVGFEEGSTLKKVTLTGGPGLTILNGLPAGSTRGATWAPDDTIIFATADPATGLQRVPAGGGDVTVLTRPVPARGELDHVWPEMLPGGRAVLFTIAAATGGLDAAQVAVLDLETGTPRVLVPGGSHARYVPSGLGSPNRAERAGGHLVYTVGGTLRAVPFDLARLETRGTPVTVLPSLATKPEGAGDFDVAADGTLAYIDSPGAGAALNTLVWVDRQGREEPLDVPARPYFQPRVSRDGTRVALAIGVQSNTDIWVLDLARRTFSQLTFGPPAFAPVWTWDERRVLFFSPTPGASLFWRSADGTGNAESLGNGIPSSVTPDGKQVLFSSLPGARDVMALTLDSRRHVEALVKTPPNERNGVVSPDGRWLAYESDSSEKFEIYVTPLPNISAGLWKVSTTGGMRPLWAPSSEELFYEAPGGAVMGVRVEARGSIWDASTPAKLVEGPYVPLPGSVRNFDVSPDGKRFLMVKAAPAAAPQITLVQNWAEELRRLAPAAR